jgi:PKD repeat protein
MRVAFILIIFFYGVITPARCQFSPSDISGLQLWLIGDSVNEIFSSIDTVYDYSLNGNHAVQTVSADKPVSVTSNLNGHKVIRFDGVADHLSLLGALNIQTVFYVFKYSGGSVAFSYPTLIGSTDNPPKYVSLIENNTDFFRVSGETFCTNYFINGNNTNSLTPLMADKICMGTRTTNQILSNAQIGTSYAFHPQAVFWGDIAEIIVYNTALTTIQRQQVEQYLNNKYAPPVNLGADINVNYGFCDTTLNAGSSFTNYLWSTGATTQTIQATQPGSYWVQATNIFGFISSDTITVYYPDFNYNGNTIVCNGSQLTWNTALSASDYSFLWQDNSTTNQYTISSGGNYQVTVTDSFGCSASSPVTIITQDNYPGTISLGSDTTFCLGGTLQLSIGQLQTLSYLWSTGATTSSIVPPSPGIYWVRGTNVNGCTSTDTVSVTISGVAATVNFTAVNFCEGDSVQFTDTSIPPMGDFITNWSWNFSDNPNSTLQNPKHLFADSGFYSVTLVVTTNIGCVSQQVQQVHIIPKPQPLFSSQNLCANQPTAFISGTNYFGYGYFPSQWNFGDPSTGPLNSSSLTNPSHFFSAADTFYVQLTATNNYGCTDSVTNQIIIRNAPSIGFTNTLACSGQQVYFSDTSTIDLPYTITTHYWDFNNSYFSSSASDSTSYLGSGGYNVQLIVSASNGCIDTLLKPIIVYATPNPVYTISGLCQGDTTYFTDVSTVQGSTINSWQWIFDGADSSLVQNANYVFNTAGVYSVSFLVGAANGCYDSITSQLTVNPKPQTLFTMNPNGGAIPLVVNFNNQTAGATAYSWAFGDNSSSSQFQPTHVYTDTGIVNVILYATNTFGCTSADTQLLQILSRIINVLVTDLHPVLNFGYLNLSADITNISTVDLYDLDMLMNVNDVTVLRENYTDTFPRFATITYQFSSQVFVPDNNHYVCVEAIIPNPDVDVEVQNNKLCEAINVENFFVGDIVPNPTNNDAYIPILIPFDDDLVVEIYDASGKKVNDIFNAYVNKGLQLIKLDIANYSKGMYAVVVRFLDKQQVKKLIKN